MTKETYGDGYILTAGDNLELILVDPNGTEIARTKSVLVPQGETLNTWQEVAAKADPEPTPVILTEEELKQQRIAKLEAELAELKGETATEGVT